MHYINTGWSQHCVNTRWCNQSVNPMIYVLCQHWIGKCIAAPPDNQSNVSTPDNLRSRSTPDNQSLLTQDDLSTPDDLNIVSTLDDINIVWTLDDINIVSTLDYLCIASIPDNQSSVSTKRVNSGCSKHCVIIWQHSTLPKPNLRWQVVCHHYLMPKHDYTFPVCHQVSTRLVLSDIWN